jgi:hypothetical protein
MYTPRRLAKPCGLSSFVHVAPENSESKEQPKVLARLAELARFARIAHAAEWPTREQP